ncbi:MAG: ribonuclease HII [Luteolibacter sp.]
MSVTTRRASARRPPTRRVARRPTSRACGTSGSCCAGGCGSWRRWTRSAAAPWPARSPSAWSSSTPSCKTAPAGLRDSKLLTPAARERLVPRLRRWAPAWAVGHAGADEIDEYGILRALRLAGERALAQLPEAPDHVLLDGSYDWLTRPAPTLFDEPDDTPPVRVTTRIKADLRCAGVAAASVLAKTTRDAIMVEHAREHPAYGWAVNKGYASPEHRTALLTHGPCVLHRRSWNLLQPQDEIDLTDPVG